MTSIENIRFVVLFPTKAHLGILLKFPNECLDHTVVVLPDEQGLPGSTVELVSETQFSKQMVPKLRAQTRALCCTEAALYFAKAQGLEQQLDLGFSSACFRLFLKAEMNREFDRIGIPFLKKILYEDNTSTEVPELPCILKPNFGFGSLLVKKITTPEQFREYVHSFDEKFESGLIREYADRYFKHLDRSELKKKLIERDRSDLSMLSVPFLARNGVLVESFPIQAGGQLLDEDSDLRKTFFKSPCPEDRFDRQGLNKVISSLITAYALRDGVYHAEFLAGARETYLLEFSPRMTGGALPKLIFYSHGIDLQKLCFSIFFGQESWQLSPLSEPRNIKLLRQFSIKSAEDAEAGLDRGMKELEVQRRMEPNNFVVDMIIEE